MRDRSVSTSTDARDHGVPCDGVALRPPAPREPRPAYRAAPHRSPGPKRRRTRTADDHLTSSSRCTAVTEAIVPPSGFPTLALAPAAAPDPAHGNCSLASEPCAVHTAVDAFIHASSAARRRTDRCPCLRNLFRVPQARAPNLIRTAFAATKAILCPLFVSSGNGRGDRVEGPWHSTRRREVRYAREHRAASRMPLCCEPDGPTRWLWRNSRYAGRPDRGEQGAAGPCLAALTSCQPPFAFRLAVRRPGADGLARHCPLSRYDVTIPLGTVSRNDGARRE